MADPTCLPACSPNLPGSGNVLPPPAGGNPLGSSCATPLFVQPCAGPLQVEISDIALGCALDGAGVAIGVVVLSRTADETTGAVTQVRTMFPYDGSAPISPYAGAFGVCDTYPLVANPVHWVDEGTCFEGKAWYSSQTGALSFVTFLDGTIVTPTPVGILEGGCPPASTLQQRRVFGGGTNIASGALAATFDPDGNGSAWGWSPTAGADLQSFTVTATRAGNPASGNEVLIRFGATGSRVRLIAGQSFTWSVAQDDGNTSEVLDLDFRVDCIGNSAASIVWTEQS